MSRGWRRLAGSGLLMVSLVSCIDCEWGLGSLWLLLVFVSWVASEQKAAEGVGEGSSNCRRSRRFQLMELNWRSAAAEISLPEGNNASVASGFLSMPCRLSFSAHIRANAAMNSGSAPAVGKILLVEDIEINRMLLRKLFKDLNLLFEEAENGQVAVDYFKQGKKYDLVLMDKEMPVMDGHEATRQLRLLGVKTPIIALTGNSLESDKDMFFEAGADEFKTKPLSREELVWLLARYGVERRPAFQSKR